MGIMGLKWNLVVLTVISSQLLANSALDFKCLKCICETATLCVSSTCDFEKCEKIESTNHECSCGPFGITPKFWMSANKPTLDENDEGTDAEKFKRCVESFPCSIWAIKFYMGKYAQDCNEDKSINCDDYVLLYTFGNRCQNASLDEEHLKRYKGCMNRSEEIRPIDSEKSTVALENKTQINKGELPSSQQADDANNTTTLDFELHDNYDVFT